jgi:membrane fusion protein (multidrug efflux system)
MIRSSGQLRRQARAPGLAALAAAAGLLAACDAPEETEAVEFRVPVSVAEVGAATLEDRIVTTGTLRAAELVTLNSLDAGVLVINADANGRRYAEGDFVSAGDEIARIVGEDIRLAARTVAARSAYQAALAELDANRNLLERGLISQSAFDTVQSNFEQARVELDRALRTEERNMLVTPIDGVILKLARDADGQLLANGQLINTGQLIAQVAPLDILIADIDVIGEDIATVRVGLEAHARYYAWDDVLFPGHVLRLAPVVDPRTRALRAEVEIANPDYHLRPGMFVEVALIAERRENVPVIPRQAVTDRGGRRVVFVLNGQRVQRREVRLGLGDDEQVEVREGVAPGERIVVRGLETLTDEMLVRVTGQ